MNDNTSPADRRSRLGIIRITHLVVVNHHITIVLVPNLDAEQIHISTGGERLIRGSQHKAIVARPVDGTATLKLGFVSGHHQPFVTVRLKIQISRFEAELGIARGDIGPLFILRHKAEVRLAGQCGIRSVGSRRGVDPAAAGHKAALRIVDNHVLVDSFSRNAGYIAHRQLEGVDPRCSVGVAIADRPRTIGFIHGSV